jgi:acetyl-CoA carboxylase carboxyltransferase component
VNRLPLINLVESTGAAAPAGPPPGGAIAARLSQLTADRVPTVCVVFGATTGDAAYLPALSDYTIMVRGHAKVLTIHPQPVRSGANGRPGPEVRSAPTVPAGVTGPADQLAEDERDGLRLARQCVRPVQLAQARPGPADDPASAAPVRHRGPAHDGRDRSRHGVRAARGAGPDPRRQRLRRVQAEPRALRW